MSKTITCKAKLSTKMPFVTDQKVDQVALRFYADYSDRSNEAWAKYTPVLDFGMVVFPEVAEGLEVGQNYTVTFVPES